jgi:hypothetical protein
VYPQFGFDVGFLGSWTCFSEAAQELLVATYVVAHGVESFQAHHGQDVVAFSIQDSVGVLDMFQGVVQVGVIEEVVLLETLASRKESVLWIREMVSIERAVIPRLRTSHKRKPRVSRLRMEILGRSLNARSASLAIASSVERPSSLRKD